MQDVSATSAVVGQFLVANRIRLTAALVAAGLGTIIAVAANSVVFLLLLGPVVLGLLVVVLGSPALNARIDGWRATFAGVGTWAEPRPGRVARYFAHPLSRGSARLWTRTDPISDVSVRCGMRITAVLYLWAAMIALLAAAVYVIIGVVMLVAVIAITGWVLRIAGVWDGGAITPGRGTKQGLFGMVLLASRDGSERRVYKKTGMFSEEETGRVDADGTMYESKGLFSEEEVGRVDADGRVYRRLGLFSEEETHRIADDGRIFMKTGMFSEEEAGRVDSDGAVYKKTGLFSEEEIGRIEELG